MAFTLDRWWIGRKLTRSFIIIKFSWTRDGKRRESETREFCNFWNRTISVLRPLNCKKKLPFHTKLLYCEAKLCALDLQQLSNWKKFHLFCFTYVWKSFVLWWHWLSPYLAQMWNFSFSRHKMGLVFLLVFYFSSCCINCCSSIRAAWFLLQHWFLEGVKYTH